GTDVFALELPIAARGGDAGDGQRGRRAVHVFRRTAARARLASRRELTLALVLLRGSPLRFLALGGRELVHGSRLARRRLRVLVTAATRDDRGRGKSDDDCTGTKK